MALYRKNSEDVFVEWRGEPVGGILHPLNIEKLWSDEELEAVGLFKLTVQKPDLLPGEYIDGYEILDIDGKPTKVPTVHQPTADMIAARKAAAYRDIVAMTDNLTRPILSRYPEGERALWLAKQQEAAGYLSTPSESRTRSQAPIIDGICQQQFGDQLEADRLASILDKAQVIQEKADTWMFLSVYVEAFRSRHDLSIDAATTYGELEQIVSDAGTEMGGMIEMLGL